MKKSIPKNGSLSYDRKMETEPITPAEYRAFQKAYDFFNAELFGRKRQSNPTLFKRAGR